MAHTLSQTERDRCDAQANKAYEIANELAHHDTCGAQTILIMALIILTARGLKVDFLSGAALVGTLPTQAILSLGLALESNKRAPTFTKWGS